MIYAITELAALAAAAIQIVLGHEQAAIFYILLTIYIHLFRQHKETQP